MKRLATLLLAAGLVFGATQAAQAVEFKGSGIFQAYFGWSNAHGGETFPGEGENDSDRFQPSQRVRLKLEMIASENLRAVFQIENNIRWGRSNAAAVGGGGAVGGDGFNVQVKHAYLDWVIPTTDVQVRIGLQNVALPGMVVGSAVFDDDVTGIVISKAFNENVAATLFWMRAEADNDFTGNVGFTPDAEGHDAVDLFGLTVPMTFEGFNVTPWVMYGQTGKHQGNLTKGPGNIYRDNYVVGDSFGSITNTPDADVWFAGITAELIAFDPFRLAIDFNYGASDTDAKMNTAAPGVAGDLWSMETSGYVVSAIAEYKLDMMTPGLLLWYASGNDSDARTDGGGVMPAIGGAAGWDGTSFGFDEYYGSGNGSTNLFGDSPVGTWGGALQFKDISFMEDMTHLFRVAYYTGTNERLIDQKGIINPWMPATESLTDDDNAWEINFNTKYAIYENLAFVLELAYISMDWDEGSVANPNWGPNKRDDAYRVNASFGYSF